MKDERNWKEDYPETRASNPRQTQYHQCRIKVVQETQRCPKVLWSIGVIITLTLFAGSYICAFLMDDAMPANAKRRLDILHYGDYQDLAHFFGVRQLPPSFKLERMIDETGRKPDTEPILQYAITLDAPDLASLLSKKSIELHPAGMVDQKWVWDVFREKPSTDLLKYHRNGSTMIIDQSSSPTLKIYLSAWI